jgi:hypothetical protein
MMISTQQFPRSHTPGSLGASGCVSRTDADIEAGQWLRDADFRRGHDRGCDGEAP